MIANLFYALLLSMNLPAHVSHSSLLQINYSEEDNSWHAKLTVDSEHLEEALEARFEKEMDFENDFQQEHVPLYIQIYIAESIQFKANKKKLQSTPLDRVFLKNGVAHFVFKPLKKRFRTKTLTVKNSFMHGYIPSQKNLVKIAYRSKSYSMLMLKGNDSQILQIE